jgi:predicted nucleotidyltransferase
MSEPLRQYDPKIVAAVREIILKYAQPSRIYLFGSRVTGEAKPESDYDFAMDAATADSQALQSIRDEVEELHTQIDPLR